MAGLTIELDGGGSWVRPGAAVEGTARWELEGSPETLELRLLWYTEGRGSRDVGVVERRVLHDAGPSGARRFRFPVPGGPYSFQGNLITLNWVVEAEAGPGGQVVQEMIVVAPTPVPVDITGAGEEE